VCAAAIFLDALKEQRKDKKDGTPANLVLHNELGAGNMHFVQQTCHGKFEVRRPKNAWGETNVPQFDVMYSDHAASRAMTGTYFTAPHIITRAGQLIGISCGVDKRD
jgi:mannosyl-oligosaccharide glucosidase